MLTSHETEKRENANWQLHPAFKGSPLHEQLALNEFKSTEELAKLRARALRKLLEHCYDLVPYYKDIFERLKIRRRHLRDPNILQEMPVLDKSMVAANAERLRPTFSAPDLQVAGTTRSTGTTGQPTVIHHDKRSLGMFSWLKQRELRWFRYDPMGTLLSIRPDIELSRTPNGSLLSAGEILKQDNWPYMAGLFQSGRSWGFTNTNNIDDQAKLLNKLKPNYLLMQSSGLEFISLQEISDEARACLHAVQGISNTLTPAMRKQVEGALQVPVHQDYGLNEIGLVAARCPEGGRYHVHEEHCVVEIVDEECNKCEPGSRGRLLVTSLSNYAMPLIRYDADDLAEAVEGICLCGRTLSSFGAVHGRYRRTAFLPEGTFQRWAAIQTAVYEVAQKNLAAVRKYQAYQDLTGKFELRIDCDENLFSELRTNCQEAYDSAYQDTSTSPLVIIRTNEFKSESDRKFQNFISEFTPERDL